MNCIAASTQVAMPQPRVFASTRHRLRANGHRDDHHQTRVASGDAWKLVTRLRSALHAYDA